MRLYNTLTCQIEDFKPLNPLKVTFYHCGPTVYWIQHIGNLRGMTMADFIRRSLIYFGYNVTFVRNYTDVGHLTSDQDVGEDKMEKGARREGLTPNEIANKYITIFENDTKALNILKPTFTPRASEYISEMIKIIQTLLYKQFAYITDQAIVYDISKFPNYNKLNRQNIDDLIKGSGKGEVDNPQKRHFADFNLWVFKKGIHKNALQTWGSPWGEGFPGWHIECSAMSSKLLGKTIDIHMGGIEHIPVHHPNEIAQSEVANGVKFVNYWLHNEHLIVDEKKMAKSEGTGIVLSQVIKKGYNPLALRYFFLQAHYRSKQNFTWQALSASSEALKKLHEYVLSLKNQTRTTLSEEKLEKIDDYRQRFQTALLNDFQTPQAVAVMWEMLKSNIPSTDKLDLLLEFDQVLGLKLNQITENIITDEIKKLAVERQVARNNKDFTRADEIRKIILEKGYEIEDKFTDGEQNFVIKKLS